MSDLVRLFRLHVYVIVITALLLLTSSVFAVEQDGIPGETIPAKNYSRLEKVLGFFEEASKHPEQYPWDPIPDPGRLLSVGTSSSAVLLIRQHLKTMHDLDAEAPDTKKFDSKLAHAVKLFQWRHGLHPDGQVGPLTLAALNITPAERAQQIRLNIQRWKDLQAKTGERFVMVNVPEFKLHLYDNNEEVLSMKAIVGKPERPTPELSSKITTLVFNPYWNVPRLIARKDIVPKEIDNPSYLRDNQIRVFTSQEDNAREINPGRVNWNNALENGIPYHFRQDPGEKNALGLVKFEFQNSHDVYLHDTPAKNLFASEARAFSSGCVRLEKPFELVTYLTQNDDRMDADRIQEKLDIGKTSYFKVREPLPIQITYITAWVDDEGLLHFVDDIYDRDGLIARNEENNYAEPRPMVARIKQASTEKYEESNDVFSSDNFSEHDATSFDEMPDGL